MGDSKKMKKAYKEYAALWGWSGDKEDRKEQWKDFRANMETFFDQMQEIQKTVIEARKETWNKIFPKLMEMQDKITDNLPEELPTPPGAPVNPIKPKEVMSKVKEFQEMANQHAVEQADSALDFCKKGQEQVKATVTETVDKIEEQLD
jgi:5,10-methenyltetrahydromethanopterin hydrogenase